MVDTHANSSYLARVLLLLAVLVSALLLGVFLFLRRDNITTHGIASGIASYVSPTSNGKMHYVSPTGKDNGDGSQRHPFKTIQKAADEAIPGTTIHVAPGNYPYPIVSRVSGTATARITFISDTTWGAKIRSTGTFTWENWGNYVDIIGFDVSGDGRDGILNRGSYVRIIGNHVHDIPASPCTSNGGAGIDDGIYPARDDDAINNVVNDIGPKGTSCNFVHGIYHSSFGGHIWNNIAFRNAGYGIHLWHAANAVTVGNNLVFANGQGGILIGAGDAPGGVTADNCLIVNNIAIYNGKSGIYEHGHTGTHNHYLNNLLYGNAINLSLQNGNVAIRTIIANPQFVDYRSDGSGDYHLTPTSPAIDAGTNIGAPTTDIEGISRPQGKAWDIGPYEYTGIKLYRDAQMLACSGDGRIDPLTKTEQSAHDNTRLERTH